MRYVSEVAMKSAIVIPTATDLNRGDQALVWEAARFVIDSGLAQEVSVIHAGTYGSELWPDQTEAEGFRLLEGLQPDPRRGRSQKKERLHDGIWSLFALVSNSLFDFTMGMWILLTANWPRLAELVLNAGQKKTLQAFREASVLVVKGGGFLHSNGELRAPYYVWFQLFYFRLAQRLGKPVIVLPNSFGPFEGFTVKWQMKRVLSRCQFIAARETISAMALGELLGREIPVYPDMGYFLRGSSEDAGRRICLEAGVPLGDKPCVGFTVRPWRFPGLTNPEARYEKFLDSIAALVRHVDRCGFHPVLVAHVLGPGAHENDSYAIEELLPRLDGIRTTFLNIPGTCRELKSVYSLMDIVVGTRFHSVIFAQGSGVPAMAVTYGGNKGQGIMVDLGLEDFALPIESVSAESLCRAFDNLIEEFERVHARLKRWQQESKAIRIQMLEEVAAKTAAKQRRAA